MAIVLFTDVTKKAWMVKHATMPFMFINYMIISIISKLLKMYPTCNCCWKAGADALSMGKRLM